MSGRNRPVWFDIRPAADLVVGQDCALLRDLEVTISDAPAAPTSEPLHPPLQHLRIDVPVDEFGTATLTVTRGGERVEVEIVVYDLRLSGYAQYPAGVPHEEAGAYLRALLLKPERPGRPAPPLVSMDDARAAAGMEPLYQPFARPRMPEKRRSRRARLTSITRRLQRQLKGRAA